jgi:hypothetical protein
MSLRQAILNTWARCQFLRGNVTLDTFAGNTDLWFPEINLSSQRSYGSIWTHDDRAFGQAVVLLNDAVEIRPRGVC